MFGLPPRVLGMSNSGPEDGARALVNPDLYDSILEKMSV
jgi:hypothetical protein